ncbi:MAG: transporter substrate-binding domain-containing protein [Bacteroidales bacterium]|jgi:PAS domain S-box-containing protein|nr:transporter substrate-binding domain-containing protein [Bacteroidales bacterium]
MVIVEFKYQLLLFFLIIPVFLFGHQEGEYLPGDTIIIASEPDYPPFCIVDQHGHADGFAVELFREAAGAVNLHLEVKIGIWNRIKQDLATGRIDALPLVGRTPEREEIFDFTMAYLSLHGAIFVKKRTTGIESLDDLKDKKIVVMKGDNAEEFVRREKVSNHIFTTNTFEEAFKELDRGRYDAVITQRITGIYLLEQLGINSIVPLEIQLPEFRQDFCFAVQEGNDSLLNKLNEGLSIIIANDTYERVKLKWLGPDEEEKINIWDLILTSLYIIVPLLILLALLFIYYLRRIIKEQTKDLTYEISQHKKTLKELNKQQLLLTEMEQVTRVGGWEYDAEKEKITWTRGVYEIYGVSPDQFDPSDPANAIRFYHPVDQLTLETAFDNAIKQATPYNLQLRLISADGKEKWVSTSGHPVIKNLKVIRVYGHITDITRQKQAADELNKKINELTAIHNASGILQKIRSTEDLADEIIKVLEEVLKYENCALLLIDQESNRLFPFALSDQKKGKAFVKKDKKYIESFDLQVGKGIIGWVAKHGKSLRLNDITKDKRYLGVRRNIQSELCVPLKLGKKIIGVINVETSKPDAYSASDQIILETLSASVAIAIENARLIKNLQNEINKHKETAEELTNLKDKLEFAVTQRTNELNEKVQKLDRSQKAMLYMVEDLNKTTSELKEQRRKLELSNKELEAFTYSVSHDLRAPLRAINGFAKFLLEDFENKLDDEGVRYIKTIIENADRMDTLIYDLLNLSRISRTSMQKIKVDMKATALSMYHEVATKKEKESFDITVEDLPFAHCDSGLIKQVWQNLLGNALKYSAESTVKKIILGAQDKEDEIIYYVKDFGAGFNADYKNKLFGVFQRLHREDEFKGTGVGLAIVQRIIHRHGGKVWADGKVKKGATFYFSIPKEK